MHFHRSLPLLASLAWIGSAALHAQIPYLETASLSFNRAFIDTGIISSTSRPVRAIPGGPGPIDPDAIKVGDRITTDIGAPIYYTGGILGDQTDWVVLSQRTVLERIARQEQDRLRDFLGEEIDQAESLKADIESLKTQIAQTADADERELLQDELSQAEQFLSLLETFIRDQSKDLFTSDPVLINLNFLLTYAKDHFTDQGARWELTAVRAPQRTADAAARTPYSIFLSRIDRVRSNPILTFDTGLSLNPMFAVGSSTEALDSNGVTRVSGSSYTTHFEVLLNGDYVEFVVATDPLHLVAKENLALAKPGIDYNKTLVRTKTFGSGYMTYSLRSTPGPIAAVTPTKIKITGHGTWTQWTERIEDDSTTFVNSRGGITPFALKMGEAKFQSSTLFPEFAAELP